MTKKSLDRFFIYLGTIIIGIIILVHSPLFEIQEINILGNSVVTDSQILNVVDTSTNMISFSRNSSRNSLLRNPYIESVVIKKDFINREITIEIVERVTIGYIQFTQDQFLYIDKYGRVLEVNSFFTRPLPIVVGLTFSEFVLGEILEIANEDAFSVVTILAYLFDKYDIEQDIVRVDISDSSNIRFYYGQIGINIGTVEDIDQKVRIVQAILPELTPMKTIGGNLDIRSIHRPWVFQLLT